MYLFEIEIHYLMINQKNKKVLNVKDFDKKRIEKCLVGEFYYLLLVCLLNTYMDNIAIIF